jgi:methylmalonyl-CoA mutase N-terminal domain/subunit
MGGAVAAIENGYLQGEIGGGAWSYQQKIETRERIVVGVNDGAAAAPPGIALFESDPAVERGECEKLAALRQARDAEAVAGALARLEEHARGETNIVPATIEAVRAYATIGEICGVLRSVWGEHREAGIF